MIDYCDFDSFIERVYGQEFEVVAAEEIGNDSQMLFSNITGKIDSSEEDKLKEFRKSGEYSYLSRTLLEDLCRQGHIEPGHYLISISY